MSLGPHADVPLQCADLVALPTWGEGALPEGPLAAEEPLFILLPPGRTQQAAQLVAKCCGKPGASSTAAASSDTAAAAGADSSKEISAAEASAAADSQQLLLVRTNEAQLSPSLAEQIAKAAGWDLAALKAAAVTKASMTGTWQRHCL